MSHPRKPGTLEEIEKLGGRDFGDIVALPAPTLTLPSYTPQVRNRRSLSGFLHEDVYILRASAVIKKTRVIGAEEMRCSLGLRASQRLVLLLFDHDELLEEMWERGMPLVRELAAAGYEAIVAPSFSTYTPRPYTEFMINSKRSMIYFRLLQEEGVHTIPRAAWIVSGDARELAQWAGENPAVEMFALDWQTYRCASDWRAQLEGLEIFDSFTGHRLSFLINGVTRQRRCEQLFEVVEPERVRITNVSTQARISPRRLRSTGDQTGVTFKHRLAVRRDVVEQAALRFRQQQLHRHAA